MTLHTPEQITFSIIIPTFNCGSYIRHALESALMQTGDDYEIIIIDDGSTDDTKSIIQSLRAQSDQHQKIHYYYQDNKGVATARNFGIQQSQGQYILLLDADDRLLSTALNKFREQLTIQKSPDYIIAGYKTIIGDKKIKITTPGKISNHPHINAKNYLRKKLKICVGSILINRNIFQKTQFAETLRKNDDIVLFAQILALFPCIMIHDPVVAIYKRDESLRNTIILSKNQCPIVVTKLIFEHPIFPKELSTLHNEALSRMFLSHFRELYKASYYHEAKQAYYQALRAYPLTIIKWPYLKKLLKIYMM